jgi:hypothetical protein
MGSVFHIVIWTEGVTDIVFELGTEGELATREVAEKVAGAYRELLDMVYARNGGAEHAFRSRVGILEIPMPDPRVRRPVPRTDVEEIMKEARELLLRRKLRSTTT